MQMFVVFTMSGEFVFYANRHQFSFDVKKVSRVKRCQDSKSRDSSRCKCNICRTVCGSNVSIKHWSSKRVKSETRPKDSSPEFNVYKSPVVRGL
jgi:hypothetical protein